MALIRAEATDPRAAHEFLSSVSSLFEQKNGLAVIGPLPALMEKRQGRYRMQLLLQANHRALLQKELSAQMMAIENSRLARKVRWSIDVDPQDFL
jgi:primosomal protein N' (replication factor Y)